MSSEQVATLEREYNQEHTAANNALTSAAAQWIGTSATALQGKLGFLQQISKHVGNELAHNSKAFRQIGTDIERTDENSAENILVTRQSR
ncbi:WXG100 family type VII secretion target [Mycobacteroides abscessus subsp. bolletii]|nr:WXG100 family type VII secretion target [Mycobacteroides abscessus subsp. bolletii]